MEYTRYVSTFAGSNGSYLCWGKICNSYLLQICLHRDVRLSEKTSEEEFVFTITSSSRRWWLRASLIGDSSAGCFTSVPLSSPAPRPCEIGSDLHSVAAPLARLSFAFQGVMNNLRSHESQISPSERRTHSPPQHDRPQ